MKRNKTFTENQIETLIDCLPHGSGIDCDWEYSIYKNGKLRLTNSIHCMDQYGGYDGYQDFAVVIDSERMEEFKVMFTGHRKEKYIEIWRDYLEEAICYSTENYRHKEKS